MGPVRQNPIQRTVSLFICVCIALCTIVAQNIAQNRPDSFPPYPPDSHHCSDDVYLREGGYKSSAVAEMGDRLAIIGMGQKVGGYCAPFHGGAGSMSPGPRLISVPSGIVIHPAV